jgi:hypothetical protein
VGPHVRVSLRCVKLNAGVKVDPIVDVDVERHGNGHERAT